MTQLWLNARLLKKLLVKMKRWYLLYCKRERVRAKQHLELQGVECFYPTVEIEKYYVVRDKVEEPLFPSYVFARFDYEEGPNLHPFVPCGVVDFVRFGAQPKKFRVTWLLS